METLCQYCDPPHLTTYHTKILHREMWYRRFNNADFERNNIDESPTLQSSNNSSGNNIPTDEIQINDNADILIDDLGTHEYDDNIPELMDINEFHEELPEESALGENFTNTPELGDFDGNTINFNTGNVNLHTISALKGTSFSKFY